MSENPVVMLLCSFCGKSQSEVKKLIAGPTVYICDECIGLCNDILADERVGDQAQLRQVLLLQINGHERSARELGELRERLGERMPQPIREALDLHGQAWSRLKGAVAESLPGVLREFAGVEESPRAFDATGVWPELTRLVATANALLSDAEKLPSRVQRDEGRAIVVARRALVRVTQLLEKVQGGKGPGDSTPTA